MEEAPRYKLPNTAHTSHIAFTAYTTYIAYTQLQSKSAISYYAHAQYVLHIIWLKIASWSSQRIVVGRTGWDGQIIALTLWC